MTDQNFKQLSEEFRVAQQHTGRWLKLNLALVVIMFGVQLYCFTLPFFLTSMWTPWFACVALAMLGTHITQRRTRSILDRMKDFNRELEAELYQMLTGEMKR